jgi:hypothetical protein
VVIGALALPYSGNRRLALGARGLGALGVVVVTACVVTAGWFHLRCMTSGYERRPLLKMESMMRSDFGIDSDMELLRPDDYAVHLPAGYYPGGFLYLMSRRLGATSFSILEHDGKYFEGQWPLAADEVVARRPRLMKITTADLTKLAGYRPEISNMYFGYDGRYMLNARRRGPEFPDHTKWLLKVDSADKINDSGSAIIEASGAILTITLVTPGAGSVGPLRGSLDGDALSILAGPRVYVGKVAADGVSIAGHLYTMSTANDPPPTFSMTRLEPIPPKRTGATTPH